MELRQARKQPVWQELVKAGYGNGDNLALCKKCEKICPVPARHMEAGNSSGAGAEVDVDLNNID